MHDYKTRNNYRWLDCCRSVGSFAALNFGEEASEPDEESVADSESDEDDEDEDDEVEVVESERFLFLSTTQHS